MVASCSEGAGTAPPDYGALLTYLTGQIIVPEHHAFAASADALDAALATLDATPTSDALAAAQTAWRAARADYRRLDALHFGPVADLGIGERIDLAPATPTDIDAIVTNGGALDASIVAAAGGHAKGFLGVEYLIFSASEPDRTLAALQASDGRRRSLAHLMGDEIAASAHQLDDAWDPNKGAYASQVEGAGATSARYPTQRAALDDLVGGVAYGFELVVGVRLAEPLGRKSGGTPDPTQDPTIASDSTAADLNATLDGIHALYDGAGLSSHVRPKSAVLDDRIESQIAACASAIGAVPKPFGAALSTDVPAVQSAYDACKSAKGTWNTDVTSALGATLKPTDNDGD